MFTNFCSKKFFWQTKHSKAGSNFQGFQKKSQSFPDDTDDDNDGQLDSEDYDDDGDGIPDTEDEDHPDFDDENDEL